ncbi:Tn7 transposase TnsA N-terminal domain-containing protein [Streptomyces zhihengii]
MSYESETELRVIQLLSFASQITYYQEQPLAISYEYDGRQRTYYPDLLAATADGSCILIEVKPVYEMAMAINIAKYRATADFCRLRGWGLVATDGSRTRRLLEQQAVDPRLENALSLALAAGHELSWPQIRAAAGVLPMGSLDLAALILSRSGSGVPARSGCEGAHLRTERGPGRHRPRRPQRGPGIAPSKVSPGPSSCPRRRTSRLPALPREAGAVRNLPTGAFPGPSQGLEGAAGRPLECRMTTRRRETSMWGCPP